MMVDIELLVETLRRHGHTVESVISLPENAGDYELTVDGQTMPLVEARLLLERQENSAS